MNADQPTVMLYSTVGCHLCVLARQFLQAQLKDLEFEIAEIDIAEDEQLLALYWDKIPVIRLKDDYLYYPFSEAEVANFVAKV